MAAKPGSYAFSTSPAFSALTKPVPAGTRGSASPLVDRLPSGGLVNLVRASAEVHGALAANDGAVPRAPPVADAPVPETIPSIARAGRTERVLAEIDQDGFAFAVDPLDARFFERRTRRAPRRLNQIDVVLSGGRVCIRKRYRDFGLRARQWGERPVPWRTRLRRTLWTALGLYLYNEAAVLLRLHDLPFVPKLRGIDLQDRAIYIDYLQGETLRHRAAASGAAVYDLDLASERELTNLSARELERREVMLLERSGEGGDFRREVADMTREMNLRGVAPLDIKLGNLIRGSVTGMLYWIDFEFACIESQPRWEEMLLLQRESVADLLELAARNDPDLGKAAEKVA
jgi:hypothetical protein